MNDMILLIEDDRWLADSYRSVVSSKGYAVAVAASGTKAMELIDQKAPQLIIADVLLGDHTSLTLFHELQSYEDTAQIPVILCTSIDTAQFADVDLLGYGIVHVFDKATMTPDQLLMCIEEIMSNRVELVS